MVSRLGTNKAFFILFGLFTLALYMLFSLVTKIAPLTISHTVYYCQKALSSILFPQERSFTSFTLPHLAPSLFVLILASILFVGLFLLVIQLSKTYFFVKKVVKDKIKVPRKVEKIAGELGLINNVDVVESELLSSFCYGLIKPRICLSLILIKALSEQELRAVLIHESYHLKNYDPLKILLSQIAASMFFFVPTLRDIHSYYTLSKEVSADRLASQSKSSKGLRSALTKILLNPSSSFSGVASFGSSNSLEQRINILTNVRKLPIKISLVRLLLSFIVFSLAVIALNMPVYAIENGDDSHSYFVCPYGGECMLSCAKQGVMKEMPFSKDQIFTPANYSPNN